MPADRVAVHRRPFMGVTRIFLGEFEELPCAQIRDSAKTAARGGRPLHRHHIQGELIFNLGNDFKSVAGFAVKLVHKGNNGNIAQAADLEKLKRLRLNTLRRVNDHNRAIGCGEGAVGVLGKVFMARRIKQVENEVRMFKCHDRGGDRNPALLLNLHPVRLRAPRFSKDAAFIRFYFEGFRHEPQIRGMGRGGKGGMCRSFEC